MSPGTALNGADGNALIFFCRRPAPGAVKTRLAEALGRAAAADLYSCFLKDLAGVLGGCRAECFVFYTPPGADGELRGLLGPGFSYFPQSDGDLGARMRDAFDRVFDLGFEKAVVIGSDVPDLSVPELDEAFDAFEDNGAVIGPALDGGYYLLGFRRDAYAPEVFEGIRWGGPDVLADTMRRFEKSGALPLALGAKGDIDTPADLMAFHARNRLRDAAPRTMRAIGLWEERLN